MNPQTFGLAKSGFSLPSQVLEVECERLSDALHVSATSRAPTNGAHVEEVALTTQTGLSHFIEQWLRAQPALDLVGAHVAGNPARAIAEGLGREVAADLPIE